MHMNKVKSQEHTVQWGERGHLQRILRMYHLHQLFKVSQQTQNGVVIYGYKSHV